MIPITLDISETINEFSLDKEESKSLSRYIIGNISREYMINWEEAVDRNLKQSKGTYKSGMRVEYPDDYSAVFILEGKGDSRLALMIEEGTNSFDQKPFFEKSDKKKSKKDGGWFLTIPFRMATADALADSSIFSGKMPEPIQNISRKSKKGIKLQDIPKEFQIKGVRREIKTEQKTYPEYEHKSTKYEGIIHSKGKHHGQYMKFRRVSDTSDENAWIHPGFQPYKLMEKAIETTKIDRIVGRSVDEFLSKTL
jgi:hypothetical protein